LQDGTQTEAQVDLAELDARVVVALLEDVCGLDAGDAVHRQRRLGLVRQLH
jgi:hypothetical protein